MSLGAELEKLPPLDRHYEAASLLLWRPLEGDLDDALEDGAIGLLDDTCADLAVPCHVEGLQILRLLRFRWRHAYLAHCACSSKISASA